MKIALRLLKLIAILIWGVITIILGFYFAAHYIITGRDISHKYVIKSIEFIQNLFKV